MFSAPERKFLAVRSTLMAMRAALFWVATIRAEGLVREIVGK